jgi:hypothetical protein
LGSSSDTKTIPHIIRFFEELGIIRKTNIEDKYLLLRVKDGGIFITLKKINIGVKIQV